MTTAGGASGGTDRVATARRRWVTLCLGLALSAALGYLAVRSARWAEVLVVMRQAHYRFLLLAAVGTVAMFWLRAWRWGVILRPVVRVGPWPLFAITAVGFLAIIAIPFRVGELMRPYLLRERKSVPFPTGLATVAAERCLDGLAFAGLVAMATPWLPLPGWAIPAGYALGGAYVVGLGALVGLWLVRGRMEHRMGSLCRRLMPGHAPAIERAAKNFLGGLAFLPDLRSVGGAALLSGAIWVVGTAVNYVSFMALGLDLPWSAAAALQIVITLGVLLPAAPGFVGSFQFFVVMGLKLYGVGEAVALSYAILIHATVLAVHAILGVVCGLALQIGWGFRSWGNFATTAAAPPTSDSPLP
jgi:glycosyltransferase 2 family protein